MSVQRYTVTNATGWMTPWPNSLPAMMVLASDYDALAAQLAEAERKLTDTAVIAQERYMQLAAAERERNELQELLRDIKAQWTGRIDYYGHEVLSSDVANRIDAALERQPEEQAICVACGKQWDGETCRQTENGWPFPVCTPGRRP